MGNENDDRFNKRKIIAEKYFTEVFKPLFQNLELTRCGEWFSEDEDPINGITLNFAQTSNALLGSFLEYKEKKRFLHFTSIQGLVNILKTGTFRLYDFNQLSDKLEFKYAYSLFEKKLSIFEEEEIKKKLFSLSLIEDTYPDIYSDELGFFWCNYGRKYQGVCLRLEIDSENLQNCSGFMLGKIQYGEENFLLLNELMQRNAAFVERENILIHNFAEIIYFICSFFKEDKYITENEVRLFSISDDMFPFSINKEINNSFKVVGYQELPINGKCLEDWNQGFHKGIYPSSKFPFPKITINEIFMGNEIPSNTFFDCCNLINEIKGDGKIKIKNYDRNKLYLL